MLVWAVSIGAFLRWIFKRCKTKLKDEIEGNFNPTFAWSYEFENLVIGIIFTILFLGLIIIVFFS
jgi:hypothetical protein